MDRAEAISLLQNGASGISEWNRRRTRGDVIPALDGASLNAAVLTKADLSNTILRSAKLRAVHLEGADLTGADLRQADLRSAILLKTNLRNCDLRDADLSLSEILGCDVNGARFEGAKLLKARVRDLQGQACGLPPTFHQADIPPPGRRAPAPPDPLTEGARRSTRVAALRSLLVICLGSLSPKEFEQICYLLVEAEDRFSDVHYLGAGGADGGRDIVALDRRPDGTTKQLVFQCKRLSSNRADVLCSTVQRIVESKVPCDYLVFITSQDLSARIMDTVRAYAAEVNLAVLFWGATKLISMLYRHRDILEQFFALPYSDDIKRVSSSLRDLSAQCSELKAMLEIVQLGIDESLRRVDRPQGSIKRISIEIIVILAILHLLEELINADLWSQMRPTLTPGPARRSYGPAGRR